MHTGFDWAAVIGTFIAAAVPSGIAIWLARSERRNSMQDRVADRREAEADRHAEREAATEERRLERIRDAADRMSIAIDELSVAGMSESGEAVTHAALRLQSAALPLLLACAPADEADLRRWVERSGVLYQTFTSAIVRKHQTDRRVVGGVVKLIEFQLADWVRGRASAEDLALDPPSYIEKFGITDELIVDAIAVGPNGP